MSRSRYSPVARFTAASRRRPRPAWITILATALFTASAIALPATPAHAACAGVTIVVDFGPLGDGVRTGCAPGNPGNGLAALEAAGFRYAFVPRQPGMICQIVGLPKPCNGAPAGASWTYYHATPGGSWIYSDEGAASYRPPAGSVEGWAYGNSREPAVTPAAHSSTSSSAPGSPAGPSAATAGDTRSTGVHWGVGLSLATCLAGLSLWQRHRRRTRRSHG